MMSRGIIADLEYYKGKIDDYLRSMETQFDFARGEIQDLKMTEIYEKCKEVLGG